MSVLQHPAKLPPLLAHSIFPEIPFANQQLQLGIQLKKNPLLQNLMLCNTHFIYIIFINDFSTWVQEEIYFDTHPPPLPIQEKHIETS